MVLNRFFHIDWRDPASWPWPISYFLVIAAGVLFVAIGVKLIIKPLEMELDRLAAQEKDTKQRIEALWPGTIGLATSRAWLEVLETRYVAAAEWIVSDQDMAGLLAEITKTGHHHSLEFHQFKPAEPGKDGPYRVHSVSMTISGEYGNFLGFIDDTLALPALIEVRSLVIRRGEVALFMEVTLELYQLHPEISGGVSVLPPSTDDNRIRHNEKE